MIIFVTTCQEGQTHLKKASEDPQQAFKGLQQSYQCHKECLKDLQVCIHKIHLKA